MLGLEKTAKTAVDEAMPQLDLIAQKFAAALAMNLADVLKDRKITITIDLGTTSDK